MEVDALNSRLENFKKMLSKMQNGLRAAKAAEDKAKATETSLQKEISGLKQQLGSSAATASASEAVASAKTDQPAPEDGEVEEEAPAPVDVAEKSDNDKETQEPLSTADLALAANPAPSDTIKVESVAMADTAATIAVDDTTAPAGLSAKKKGKKRKAATPKKNAAD